MSGRSELERLTEAVDRLIVRVETLQAQRDQLASRVKELERDLEGKVGSTDPEGYRILRIHSARLLRERQEIKRRLGGVLEKLDKIQQRLR